MWIKQQVKTGHFDSENEVVQELILTRQIQQQESLSDIRNALIEGEKSGICNLSIDEIWQETRSNDA